MRLKQRFLALSLVLCSMLFWNCDAINPTGEETAGDYSCEGCHTSRVMLENVVGALDLDPPAEAEAAPG